MSLRLSLLLAMITPTPLIAASVCVPAGHQELRDELQRAPAKELVFFASWCKSCKDHLTPGTAKDGLLVAVFDDKDKADAVVAALYGNQSIRCVWDKDGSIADHYNIKGLPFTVSQPVKD